MVFYTYPFFEDTVRYGGVGIKLEGEGAWLRQHQKMKTGSIRLNTDEYVQGFVSDLSRPV